LIRVCGAVFQKAPIGPFTLEDFTHILREVGEIEEKIGTPLTVAQIASLLSRSFVK
jgi:hypothetical protein